MFAKWGNWILGTCEEGVFEDSDEIADED